MHTNERFNSISTYLKKYFGKKTVKVSIDAGFTCPNRDGSVGYGGCLFCSSGGSGEMASLAKRCNMISKAIDEQVDKISSKWPDAIYLAYFQAHTNTYASVDELRDLFYAALNDPRIHGIVIATRPDCINDEIMELLDEINKSYFMWVELGLQTIHASSREFLNIGYPVSVYDETVDKLLAKKIKIVTHLILGLPSGYTENNGLKLSIPESEEEMIESVKYVCQKPIFGLKLHLLNVVRTSSLYKILPDYVSFDSIEDYIDIVVKCLEIIPENITIHRLTADVPRSILVSPDWSYKKRTILNGISHELVNRKTWQGRLSE